MISPVLMNVVLHGMEEAAGVRYITTGSNAGTARPGSPVLVRYADDALALCHSRGQAGQVKARLAAWLAISRLRFHDLQKFGFAKGYAAAGPGWMPRWRNRVAMSVRRCS